MFSFMTAEPNIKARRITFTFKGKPFLKFFFLPCIFTFKFSTAKGSGSFFFRTYIRSGWWCFSIHGRDISRRYFVFRKINCPTFQPLHSTTVVAFQSHISGHFTRLRVRFNILWTENATDIFFFSNCDISLTTVFVRHRVGWIEPNFSPIFFGRRVRD